MVDVFSSELLPVWQGLAVNTVWALGNQVRNAARSQRNTSTSEDNALKVFAARTLDTGFVSEIVADHLATTREARPEETAVARSILEADHMEVLVHELLTVRLLEQPEEEAQKVAASVVALTQVTHAELDREVREQIAQQIFDGLDTVCLAIVANLDAAEPSLRSAVQLLAGMSSLVATVKSIDRHLSVLSSHTMGRRGEYESYLAQYRSHVERKHGSLVLPDFEVERRIPVDDLYVEPTLSGEDVGGTSVENLFNLSRRVVVLGSPGGGKSTLANVVTLRSAQKGRQVPLLLVLREYGQDYAEGLSIVDSLEKTLRVKYQAPPPEGWVESILLSGRSLVSFDGLDELLDPSKRRDIKDAIEAFCLQYPSTQVLVTSRTVGYEQAPLPGGEFTIVRLGDFDEEAVKRYASAWFKYALDESGDERALRVRSFLEESASVSDIRSNPLMLSLMCVLYRGSNYIPENRLALYEECARLLFRKWDRSRGIKVPLEMEADIDTSLMDMAFWLLTAGNTDEGVTERELVTRCASHLLGRRYDDEMRAREAAQEFVAFCRGRAWVLVEAGSTSMGEPLYAFAHRTFLEYYAASHLVRVSGSPEAVAEAIAPRVSRDEWEVVGQLAVQLSQKNHDRGEDRILGRLLDIAGTQASDDPDKRGVLSFVARMLTIVRPSPGAVRRIARAVAEFSIDAPERDDAMWPSEFEATGAATPLVELLSCRQHVRDAVGETVAAAIKPYLNSQAPTDRAHIRAARIALLAKLIAGRNGPDDAYAYWSSWTDSLADDAAFDMSIWMQDRYAATGALEHGAVSVSQFIDRYNVNSLWEGLFDPVLGISRVGTFELLAGWLSGAFWRHVFLNGAPNRLVSEFQSCITGVKFPLPRPPANVFAGKPDADEDRLGEVSSAAYGGAAGVLCMDREGTMSLAQSRGYEKLPQVPSSGPLRELVEHLADWRRTTNEDSLSIPEGSRAAWVLIPDGIRAILRQWAENKFSFWEADQPEDVP